MKKNKMILALMCVGVVSSTVIASAYSEFYIKGSNGTQKYSNNEIVVKGGSSNKTVDGFTLSNGSTINLKSVATKQGTIIKDSINLRKSPNYSADKIVVVPIGAKVTIYGTETNGWFEISYGNYKGFAPAEYVSLGNGETPVAQNKIGAITGTNVNLRKTASYSGEVLRVVNKDTRVLVIENTNSTWSKISVDGAVGYIASEYIDYSKYNEGSIKNESVNLRKTASYSGDKLIVVPINSKVDVLSVSGDWVKLSYGGYTGYVAKQYVSHSSVDEEKPPVVKANATIVGYPTNVRSGPATSYSVLGQFAGGDRVDVLENDNGWFKIKYKNGYGYVASNLVKVDNGVTIPNKPGKPEPPVTGGGSVKKIMLDPGHGGSDPGAVGKSGLKEADVVLKVANKTKSLLASKGYSVSMTRTSDSTVSLQRRAEMANSSGTDLFVSVHANSATAPSANGIETFSYMATGNGALASKEVQSQLISKTGLTNRGTKTANFYVLKNTNMPAILTELGFISNLNEESLLRQDAFQTKCATAITNGIVSYSNKKQ